MHTESNVVMGPRNNGFPDPAGALDGPARLQTLATLLPHPSYMMDSVVVVPYELYELYDWGKVPELNGTIWITT